jgi:hypothetical protein
MNAAVLESCLDEVVAGLRAGTLVPFLGPEVALLEPTNAGLPLGADALIARLGKKVPIPGRLRKNLTAAAQYIETFRHRKILRGAMIDAFAQPAVPSGLHRWLVSLRLPLIVDLGYEAATAAALQTTGGDLSWGQVQGISRAESRAGQGEDWVTYYSAAGTSCPEADAETWTTLLYKPLGSISPAGNFLVSDADFVEVLTEIDVQTPIPDEVKARRASRGFVFIGCRFDNQLARTYARQVSKRSAGPHYALIGPDEPALTRNEQQFIEALGIAVVVATPEDLLRVVA